MARKWTATTGQKLLEALSRRGWIITQRGDLLFASRGQEEHLITFAKEERLSASLVELWSSWMGLRSEDLDRVFERGYRAPHGGVAVAGQGLGLAISKLIVVAHGGRIWATSEGPGRGSTFRVALRRKG